MAKSNASTVTKYLSEIPKEKRSIIKDIRSLILDNIDPLFEEKMNWGMISYEVPLEIYPDTYNKKPLLYIALAAQKNNLALYLMCSYQDKKIQMQLLDGFESIGKKPNMGKSCIRFKASEDLPLKSIAKIIKSVSLKKFIKQYEKARSSGPDKCD